MQSSGTNWGDDAGLVVLPTASNPDAGSVAMKLESGSPLIAQPVGRCASGSVHKLKHQRVRMPVECVESAALPSTTAAVDADSAQRAAGARDGEHEFFPKGELLIASQSLSSYHSLVDELARTMESWMTQLPTYEGLLRRVSDMTTAVLHANVSDVERATQTRIEDLFAKAAATVAAPYQRRIEELEAKSVTMAAKIKQCQDERMRQDEDERRILRELRKEIELAKASFEEREARANLSNDRIQAMYVKNREFRQIMSSREDTEREIAALLSVNQALTQQKTDLLESIRGISDSIEPEVSAVVAQIHETESRIHLLNSKCQTGKRHGEELARKLAEDELALRRLIAENETLSQQRETWSEKLAALEADALREYTPRPDWTSRQCATTTVPGSRKEAIDALVPPLSDFVDIRSTMSSSQVVDAALKKLTQVTANAKRSIDELLRMEVVIKPIIGCFQKNLQSEARRSDATERSGSAELDEIELFPSQASALPSSLVLPVGVDFADSASRLVVSSNTAVVSASTHRVAFRNDRWTQAATEQVALSMMKALPQITLSANVIQSATSPAALVNEMLAKWVASSVERDPLTGFGANFLTSLKYYSGVSSICSAAQRICYGQLPYSFGDTVVQHVESLFSQVEGGSSTTTPLRNVMVVLSRAYCQGTLFSLQQLHQAKFALCVDAAASASNIRLSSVFDINDQKRNSGLFVRCVFQQFLAQQAVVVSTVTHQIVEVAKSSPVIRLSVVSESAVRARLEAIKWDPEITLTQGLRYAGQNTSSKRFVSLVVRGQFTDALFSGLSRYEGNMLRLADEDGPAASPERDASATKESGKQSKRGEYVGLEDCLMALRCAPYKLVDKA